MMEQSERIAWNCALILGFSNECWYIDAETEMIFKATIRKVIETVFNVCSLYF